MLLPNYTHYAPDVLTPKVANQTVTILTTSLARNRTIVDDARHTIPITFDRR
jgi:hypothetical protein